MTRRPRPVRWRYVVSALALTLVGVTGAAPEYGQGQGGGGRRGASSASGSSRERKVSRRVRQQVDERRHDNASRNTATVDVMVRFRNQPGASRTDFLRAVGGEVRREHRSAWMSARVPLDAVEALSESGDVEYVATDAPVVAHMSVARVAAGVPGSEWAESGYKGAGVTIALIDSGVAQHPEVDTLVKVADFIQDRYLDPSNSVDPNGHGTHVAGILVGDGSRSKYGRLRGIAPEASLISLRVLDETGSGKTSDTLAALDWVQDNRSRYGIRVVNLSLGHPIYEAAKDDPLVQAVEELWDAGVVVVCAVGNQGADGHGTISSPCNSRKVISVGVLNDKNTSSRSDDTVATYSSRGPSLIDRVAKPDLLAPGNRIVSARAAGSRLDQQYPERRVADDSSKSWQKDHYEMSGSSMAAPMVAGAAALMLDKDSGLNPATVKARLMRSARKAAVGDPFATGAGALDILAALTTSGSVNKSPSPKVSKGTSNKLNIEDTAVLWSNSSFGLDDLWTQNVLWAAQNDSADVLSSEGFVAPTTANATLWPEGTLWWEATLWPESTLWSESVVWSDEPGNQVGGLGGPAVVDDP
jgi:serine protease AprX